mmetsp:Transcript_104949/g.296577  ORF Transcript_104949/g.296577 Transcript_104949/m.296577 type:complete len:244 (-) Transcript_104949:478-1209(-)
MPPAGTGQSEQRARMMEDLPAPLWPQISRVEPCSTVKLRPWSSTWCVGVWIVTPSKATTGPRSEKTPACGPPDPASPSSRSLRKSSLRRPVMWWKSLRPMYAVRKLPQPLQALKKPCMSRIMTAMWPPAQGKGWRMSVGSLSRLPLAAACATTSFAPMHAAVNIAVLSMAAAESGDLKKKVSSACRKNDRLQMVWDWLAISARLLPNWCSSKLSPWSMQMRSACSWIRVISCVSLPEWCCISP